MYELNILIRFHFQQNLSISMIPARYVSCSYMLKFILHPYIPLLFRISHYYTVLNLSCSEASVLCF